MTTVTSADAMEALRRAKTGVPQVIRQLMAYKRLRMYELAGALGVEPQSMSARLSGKTVIKQEELAALAVLFRVPVDVFYQSPDEALRWVLDHPATVPTTELTPPTYRLVNSAGQGVPPTRARAA